MIFNDDRLRVISKEVKRLQDLKIMAYDAEARASFTIVPHKRVTATVDGEPRSALRPIVINKKRVVLYPPKSPVRLKKLPAEETEELEWKVNYRDAFIPGFSLPKAKERGILEKLSDAFGGDDTDDLELAENDEK